MPAPWRTWLPVGLVTLSPGAGGALLRRSFLSFSLFGLRCRVGFGGIVAWGGLRLAGGGSVGRLGEQRRDDRLQPRQAVEADDLRPYRARAVQEQRRGISLQIG